MPLTNEQRAELETYGPELVRQKLIGVGAGRGADVPGFKNGYLLRGDIQDWLAEKSAQDAGERKQTLRWAMTAGRMSIAAVIIAAFGVGVSIAAIVVTIWLAK
jgi:hypothetical protein